MAELPSGHHKFYAGVDPGFSGAIALMNGAGTSLRCWDTPTTGKGRKQEVDLHGLRSIFTYLRRLPDCVVLIEWPTMRPGEGAQRGERFGRQKGYLEAFALLHGLPHYKVPPNLWKGRLGIPGKTDRKANQLAAKLFEQHYPAYAELIRGKRGGIKDGRCDAFLIAHFARTRTYGGLQAVVEKFGRDSAEAQSHILSMGKRGGWRPKIT